MKRTGSYVVGVAMVGVVASMASASARPAADTPPVFLTTIPAAGYRDWRLISVAHEEANLNSFAAVLGNDLAIKAYRDGDLHFADGAIIASLHYRFVPSEENNTAFGQAQSFVAGDPTNVQFMVKDSKAYASTGGWGYGHFNQDGTAAAETLMKTCAPCHAKASRDSVFTRYSR
jgi:cytochrome P460